MRKRGNMLLKKKKVVNISLIQKPAQSLFIILFPKAHNKFTIAHHMTPLCSLFYFTRNINYQEEQVN